MKEWYYISGGNQIGPISAKELINKKNSSEIAPTDLVWKDGMAEWLPFREVSELVGVGLQPQQTTKRHITREVALDFVNNYNDHDESGDFIEELNWGTSIDHSAARVLESCVPVLRLKGLIEIDDLTAQSLAKYDGVALCLDGLENVTDLGLKHLSSSLSAQLQLSGKILRSKSRAEYLAQNYDGLLLLGFDGKEVSDDIFEGLSEFRGQALKLDGLTSISAGALASLAASDIENLILPVEVFEDEDHELDDEMLDRFLYEFKGSVDFEGDDYGEDGEDDSLSIDSIKIDEGNPSDEFIVKVDFYYCEVSYEGYMIADRETISVLNRELDSGREVYTPNMPGDWCEEFEISKLEGAFTVHSEKAEDVEAMRKLFGESIGNVELITMITDMVDTDELAEESDDDDD